MFIHNLKYTLITLFRNKELIFWTFAFPILLATFFNMAFSDIEKNEVEDYVVRELGKKLAAKEVKVLSVEDKKYNIAKRKFKAWKNSYKNEHQV